MTGLFIIAHAPLASALRSAAMHAYPELAQAIGVYDVPPGDDRELYFSEASTVIDALGSSETLILTDMLGATPAILAGRLEGTGRRALAGVNVPMLWRALNYWKLPLDQVFDKALEGARLGLQSVTAPPPQDQARKPPSNDPNDRYHQQ